MNLFRIAASAMLTVFLLFSFCGCGKKKTDAPQRETAERAVVEKEKKEAVTVSPSRKTEEEDYEEGSLKVKLSNSSAESGSRETSSPENASNVVIVRKEISDSAVPSSAAKTKALKKSELDRKKLWTPNAPGTLAALMALRNADKEIRWTPFWTDFGVGGVRIPDAVLSGDSSILVFLETTGGATGPFGTRLIAYDTHRWIVTALFQLDRIHAVSGCMIANTGRLALIARGQGETESDSLVLFDLQTGEISDRLVLDYAPARLFANPNSGRLTVTEKDSSVVRIYNSGNLQAAPKQLKCGGNNPAVAFAGQGEILLLAAGGKLEQYKTSDLRPLSSETLPAGFVPWNLAVLSGSEFLLAPPKGSMEEPLFLSNRSVRKFGENSGGQILVPGNRRNQFFSLRLRKGEIVQYQLPSLEPAASVIPEDVRPKTVGDPFKLFWIPQADCLAVLDARGSFYLLYRGSDSKGKWNKS
jgi:hypothetical protein